MTPLMAPRRLGFRDSDPRRPIADVGQSAALLSRERENGEQA
jgi:hypothetical protein